MNNGNGKSLLIQNEQFRFMPTGLVVMGEPDFATWEQLGQQLHYIEGAVHWWIGDWENYGEGRWGEMYSQALEETGFAYQTLANDKWIAGQIEFSRRRENLTFSHHAEVAPLPPDAQQCWLDRAENEDLSVRELRQGIKLNPSGIQALPDSVIQDLPESVALYSGDFRDVLLDIEPDSVDVIITDPPYPREYLSLYQALACHAARVLKPGGSLLAMAGQSYLNRLYPMMDEYLAYHWTISYLTPGGQSPQIWPRKVNTFWKPILWYVKGEYGGDWHGDVIKSDVNDNDKRFHHWGQSESGIARLVDAFSSPGDLILDPFVGGGTTGIVAIAMSRRFIGIDISDEAITTTRQRLGERHNGKHPTS